MYIYQYINSIIGVTLDQSETKLNSPDKFQCTFFWDETLFGLVGRSASEKHTVSIFRVELPTRHQSLKEQNRHLHRLENLRCDTFSCRLPVSNVAEIRLVILKMKHANGRVDLPIRRSCYAFCPKHVYKVTEIKYFDLNDISYRRHMNYVLARSDVRMPSMLSSQPFRCKRNCRLTVMTCLYVIAFLYFCFASS